MAGVFWSYAMEELAMEASPLGRRNMRTGQISSGATRGSTVKHGCKRLSDLKYYPTFDALARVCYGI